MLELLDKLEEALQRNPYGVKHWAVTNGSWDGVMLDPRITREKYLEKSPAEKDLRMLVGSK